MSKKAEIEEQVSAKVENLYGNVLRKPPPSNIVELWKEHLEIRRVLNSINQLLAEISDTNERLTKNERNPEVIKTFLEWSDHIGIARNNVEVFDGGKHGLELRATGHVAKEHIVVKVPRRAMVTLDLAKKSAILKKAFERDPIVGRKENMGFALFIAAQWLLRDKSKWLPYLSVLPNSFSSPIFYTEDQLLQLKPSPIFEESLLFYRAIARQYAYFYSGIYVTKLFENNQKHAKKESKPVEPPVFYNSPFTAANFTPNLYMWAVGVVTTRVNMVPSEIEKTEKGQIMMMPALIPVLDMANHESFSDSHEIQEDHVCFDPEADCAVITVHQEVNAGDQVTIFYGKRSNGDHLLHNGFVPTHQNVFDLYKLKIGIPKCDKDFEAKKRLIFELVRTEWSDNNILHFDLFNDPKHPFSEDLVKFSSIFVTQSPNKTLIEQKEAQKKGIDFLKNRLMLLERSYGNSVDLQLLNEVGINGDITRLKSSELHILRLARQYCDQLEKLIK